MSILKVVVLVIASSYVLIALLFYLFQERFIFLPQVLKKEYEFDFPFEFEERTYLTPGGGIINAIFVKSPNPKGVVYYHHGNADNLNRWGDVAVNFQDMGYDVLVYDFRGYGKSRGKRTMKYLLSDSQIIYNDLKKAYGEDQIVLYGRSLGTGIASWLAGQNKPRKLLLETPYFSLADVAEYYYPIFPIKQLLRFPFNSHKYLETAQCPIFIFHGTEDEIVPYRSGKKLFDHLKDDKEIDMLTIEGGMHGDLGLHEEFQKKMVDILD